MLCQRRVPRRIRNSFAVLGRVGGLLAVVSCSSDAPDEAVTSGTAETAVVTAILVRGPVDEQLYLLAGERPPSGVLDLSNARELSSGEVWQNEDAIYVGVKRRAPCWSAPSARARASPAASEPIRRAATARGHVSSNEAPDESGAAPPEAGVPSSRSAARHRFGARRAPSEFLAPESAGGGARRIPWRSAPGARACHRG
jgi:hypothetical protein